MKNISKYWLLFMIAAMSATSCSDDDNEKVVMPDPDPTTLGWVKQATEFGTLPEYISVYKSPTELEGMKAIAFIAVADMSKANFASRTTKISDNYEWRIFCYGSWKVC